VTGPRVELRGVSKSYGPVRAVVRASARFDAGRTSIIRGANGAGKSTLLAVLATLARPSSGSIDYGSIGSRRGEIRRSVGWLGSESLCYLDLSGRQNIELAARLYGVAVVRAFEDASERFGLSAFAERPMRTYSRGQRQRLALARALVNRPSLLLLDEPTTGLDVEATAGLAHTLRQEAQEGTTIIVATHDATFAREVGNDYFRMEGGRLEDQQDRNA
jgi:ABC-type multidrug transport system ATPase subunit